MNRSFALALALALALTLVADAPPVGAAGWARSVDVIKVTTRNEYLGADLTPIIVAQTPEEFVQAATDALTQIALNDFPTRAQGIAREVKLTRPDVIGLQEAFDFTINGLNTGPPFVDMLQTTLDALEAVGLQYEVAAFVEHLDVTLPLDLNGDEIPELIRVRDRDALLVREGLPFTRLDGDFTTGGLCGVPIPNPAPIPPFPPVFSSTVSEDGCNYTVVAGVDSPLGPIVIERGFVGIDVTVRGETFRVVNTHLEVQQPDPTDPNSAIIQSLQSVELAGTLQVTTPPGRKLIAVGDYNSSPEDLPLGPIVPPYQVMTGAGFHDVWDTNPLTLFDPDGFTCCQDSDLANPTSLLDERIDLIFVQTAQKLLPLALVTGRVPLPGQLAPPLWAADHAGVWGKLIFVDK